MSLHRHPLIKKIMSRSSKGIIINANTSSKNAARPIIAAVIQSIEKDGVNTTLPLSIGHQIQNQSNQTVETVSIQRYEALQNEYAAITKRYKSLYDAFSELRIELHRLQKERDEAWKRKK